MLMPHAHERTWTWAWRDWLHGYMALGHPCHCSVPGCSQLNTTSADSVVQCRKQATPPSTTARPTPLSSSAREVTAELEEEEQKVQMYTCKALALFLQVLYCRVAHGSVESQQDCQSQHGSR